ncbi:hypothetical protein LCGC14_1108300 [marine sediment metagenome]|uniref:Uncharacterized protein n=1 Tax=marine sediment metagenome TaxID=412755 RepID=A0A0F9MVG1_9ZZZZ
MKFWPLELLYPINHALHEASVEAGKDKKDIMKRLPWRPRWRIKIWIKSEYLHWWRWKGFIRLLRHNFLMWQHKHNLRCRCVSYHQRTGEHAPDCPKSPDFTPKPQENK